MSQVFVDGFPEDPFIHIGKQDSRRPTRLLTEKAAAQQGLDSTAQVFAQFDFAWVAYHVATRRSVGKHFPGQSRLQEQISQLRELSPEQSLLVAHQVDNYLRQKPNLAQKILKWFEAAKAANSCEQPVTESSAVSPSDLSHHGTMAIGSDATMLQTPIATNGALPVSLNDEQASPADRIFYNAFLKEATAIFPNDLARSICREIQTQHNSPPVAGIDMRFSPMMARREECKMAVRIKKETVAHFAQKFFKVHLEETSGLRYLRLPGSATKVSPTDKMVFKGCRRDILDKEFGPEVGHAIKKSQTYMDEESKCEDGTDAVWMLTLPNAEEGAELWLTLGILQGTNLKMKLFPGS